MKRPAILIPLPWAGGCEQQENGKLLEEAGIGQVLPQEELTPDILSQTIKKAIQNLENFKKNAPKAKRLIKLDAAERLAEEVLSLAEGRRLG
ncbi:hypothetical protein A2Z23_00530 [Candidatus Curtissbacteria bacterium RBG_16_39_7]|uniref:Glycosyl transferase family 28 C-terminal domain-containing protein n=1 Tax=Candidatus Curtissbacteria bacterium RBG_16_39_7 TaxID=1797707 RepID=A0A1F5G2V0_9BACT|nr:MAG: hypothetical protein A2Z23_00530 [Candidatus Curtissbacteria bacterium RBG_16_39_7]